MQRAGTSNGREAACRSAHAAALQLLPAAHRAEDSPARLAADAALAAALAALGRALGREAACHSAHAAALQLLPWANRAEGDPARCAADAALAAALAALAADARLRLGFERVFVRAGETVTVYLGAQGVRFTQAGADGVRRALRGEYTVRFGVRETAALGMGFAETRFTAL